jgi:hypothetical protein
MSKVRVRSFEGVEDYEVTHSCTCETCCRLIMKDEEALLIVYSIKNNPLSPLSEYSEGDKRLIFERHCEDCGEIFRIKNNV